MKYDIFISYRRKDTSGRSNVPTARQFKLVFEAPPYNYKVFFDYSECTDNYFSDIILPAIRTCDFFVLVLTKDCLLRCSNEGDWVRREIEEAIAYNRKIIPITPDKECESIPSGLPASLRKLDGLQITTVYTDHMFEACVEFLVKNRFHIDSEAERKAKEEAERARIEKERIAKAEAERRAREVAERERMEKERKAEEVRQKSEKERKENERLEAERKAKQAEERARLEKERITKAEVERKAKETSERERVEKERKAEEEKRKAGEETERARLEKVRIEREEADRKAKETAERLEREQKTEQASSIINGHEYVDLGLPSGTLWATCNLGASKPEDYGDYFAWGEIRPKANYNLDTYKYTKGISDKLTKYCNKRSYGRLFFTDNLIELQVCDDPATANWGNDWQTPSEAQWNELRDNTTLHWTTHNDVKGWLFTSKKNGGSLFLPAAGGYKERNCNYVGNHGNYWSSSLYTFSPYNAWCLGFDSIRFSMCPYDRNCGLSVRPVRTAK